MYVKYSPHGTLVSLPSRLLFGLVWFGNVGQVLIDADGSEALSVAREDGE